MDFFLLIFCGLITGLLSGMLGIGGGVILVPMFYFLFRSAGCFTSQTMQVAASTALAISLFSSLLSALTQYSKNTILFSAFKFLVPGLIIGCICGAYLAQSISSEIIRCIFGIGACMIGIYFTIPHLPEFYFAKRPNPTLSFFGLLIGTLSSLLGIGGGILTFPTLLSYGVRATHSSATASCITTLSSLIGTLTYLFIAWKQPTLPGTFGYIETRVFLTTGLAALCTTWLGVKLSLKLNTHLLKRIFGICLCLVGLTMLVLNN